MKILLTGGTSFTGLWFAKALVEAGHKVVATTRGDLGNSDGVRGVRIRELAAIAEIRESISFGDDGFLAMTRSESFDVLCHHAAEVGNYKSLDFDVSGAIAANTKNMALVLEAMKANGLRAVVATGSVFENDNGVGDGLLEAFSPYGLSKSLSYQVVRFWARRVGVRLGKFNIANPFGVLEEPRFCNFLIQTWAKGETARVNTPTYLRDNIFVDRLALHYAAFVADIVTSVTDQTIGPIGFAESQGAFAQRFAAAMRPRLGLECKLELGEQINFDEPMIRLNSDRLAPPIGWSDDAAWDRLAAYYAESLPWLTAS
ncbi:hypothetical protein GCM10017620_23070 [Brevundimonas intermedia]|uniref:NAD-dependent epimerase/dehydratase domain-containing protein n=1 Tax=Brevundimonas intermedia TaxID=74315 RepID=A0ABQ5TBA8_9CAUL|nr:NAD(P)-dependent oxidoreductase [Brevundimonas intermedia]GLK49334.1 hypothetical protein GCM10017620_23070 [Brevundimonas intermedia]